MLRSRHVPAVLALALVAGIALAGCSAASGDPCTHATRAAELAADGDMSGAAAELDKIGTVDDVEVGAAVAALALGIEGDASTETGIAAVQDICG